MKVRIILIALLATLVGTAHTLYALHNLLAPVTLTFLALREYLSKKTLPSLPTKFTDEAGILMADTSHTINKLNEVIQYMVNYDDLTGLPNRLVRNINLGEKKMVGVFDMSYHHGKSNRLYS